MVSPDGSLLVFEATSAGQDGPQIYAIPRAGQRGRLVVVGPAVIEIPGERAVMLTTEGANYDPTFQPGGERIDFMLRANAFLHHMVRNIVGTLLYVGSGRHAPAWAGEVLASRTRGRAAPTFAAEGLYLERVEYAAHCELPEASRGALGVPALP